MPQSSRTGALYLDTSAAIKLVVSEVESAALAEEIGQWDEIAISDLGVTELRRAIFRRRYEKDPTVADDRQIQEVLDGFLRLPVTADIYRIAGELPQPGLRTLDALHLATALELVADLGALVTYDNAMTAAAKELDIPLLRPS